jgi:RNA methyltransferase, TrmH family
MRSVASRDNAAFKAMARLVASAAERRKRGLTVLDGPHLLAASLDAGIAPEEVVVSPAGAADPEIARLLQRAAHARVTLLTDTLFDALSTVDTPTGVMASVPTPRGRPAPADARMVLLLEDIQDPGNVGTLLRSAAAAGCDHVLLSPHCAFAWAPKVLRAAMGAHFAVNIVEKADLAAWLAGFRGTSIGLAGEAGASLYELELATPLALVVGNEGAGLSPALRGACGRLARIPMPGRIESLNAATAASIALFEAVRQRAARAPRSLSAAR